MNKVWRTTFTINPIVTFFSWSPFPSSMEFEFIYNIYKVNRFRIYPCLTSLELKFWKISPPPNPARVWSNHLLLLKCRQFLPLLFLQHFHFKFLELGSCQVPQHSMLTVILVTSHSTVHTPVYDVTKLDLICK